jgi:transcriptional regulator with XRE-family HTH domain
LADAVSSFAERLRGLRGRLSTLDFAKNLGISHGALNNYEKGKTFPSGKRLIHISGSLDVNPQWLLLGTGPRAPWSADPGAGEARDGDGAAFSADPSRQAAVLARQEPPPSATPAAFSGHDRFEASEPAPKASEPAPKASEPAPKAFGPEAGDTAPGTEPPAMALTMIRELQERLLAAMAEVSDLREERAELLARNREQERELVRLREGGLRLQTGLFPSLANIASGARENAPANKADGAIASPAGTNGPEIGAAPKRAGSEEARDDA